MNKDENVPEAGRKEGARSILLHAEVQFYQIDNFLQSQLPPLAEDLIGLQVNIFLLLL